MVASSSGKTRYIADKYGVKSEDQLKLKRVSNLITAYEKIVEGNYIDNLIRAQRERDRTIDNANLIK